MTTKRPNGKCIFRSPRLSVFKDFAVKDPSDAFNVVCMKNGQYREPKDWSLSISDKGNLLMVLVKY